MSAAGRDSLQARAEMGARELYRLGARRVWLFGSLAQGHVQDGYSDIDLAVEGIPHHRLVEATRRVRGVTRRITDIVAIEEAAPEMRASILRTCRLLVPPADGSDDPLPMETRRRPITHYQRRLDAVLAVLAAEEVRSVLDFGCGEGWLLATLAAEGRLARLGGVDLDREAVCSARDRVGAAAAASGAQPVVDIWQGLITHDDERLLGYHAATAIEVIEHLEGPPLAAFTRVLFGFARPRIAIMTTPNAEYNALWGLPGRRHPDHRFEWDRSAFAHWAAAAGDQWEYSAVLLGIGPKDPAVGHPTQMAVFGRAG